MSEENTDANKLIKYLVISAVVLICLNIANNTLGRLYWQITRFIDLDGEANFSAWFSSIILAIASYYAFKCSKKSNEYKNVWRMIAIGLLCMSCEEVAMVHENLEIFLGKHFLIKENWTLVIGPFILLALLIAIVKIRKFFKLHSRANHLFVTGSICYLLGAFILESTLSWFDYINHSALFIAENIIEESFEIFGVIILIRWLVENSRFIDKERIVI